MRCSEGFVENFGAALLARIAREAPGVRMLFQHKLGKDSGPMREGLETGVVTRRSDRKSERRPCLGSLRGRGQGWPPVDGDRHHTCPVRGGRVPVRRPVATPTPVPRRADLP